MEVQNGVSTQSLVIDIICRDGILSAGECGVCTDLQPLLYIVFGIDTTRITLLVRAFHDTLQIRIVQAEIDIAFVECL